MSKHYYVTSPEVSEVIPGICDDGKGPHEYFHIVVEVEADNARDAKAQAIRSPEFRNWLHEARGDGRNPFTGLKAEAYECEHGCPVCCDPQEH